MSRFAAFVLAAVVAFTFAPAAFAGARPDFDKPPKWVEVAPIPAAPPIEGAPAIPADGVYAGWLHQRGDRLPAAISVGTNPTFDGAERRVECYVLDRDDLDLYGASVRVEFTSRIRGQERFSDVDALIERMAVDVEAVRGLLAGRG